MNPPGRTYRGALVGASSLLGKELLTVLRERRFPLSSMVEIDAAANPQSTPELPILDLEGDLSAPEFNREVHGDEIDLAFVAARPAVPPPFLRPESARPALLIDLDDSLGELRQEAPRIALLETDSKQPSAGPAQQAIAAAHPATIVISLLLLRLAARAELSSAVALMFAPASHLGPRAIGELQRQTVNLLGFQKIPRAVFGAQLAFNLLPQISGSGSAAMGAMETRVRGELSRYLSGRTFLPALRVFQAPVFYSMAVSLYVETTGPLTPAQATEALAGEGVRLRRASEQAPSQLDATGTAEIAVGAVLADPSRDHGLWIWAAADDLRLAAQNAVEIAERLTGQKSATRPAGARRKAV
ncbi:MAG TPA: Asd/ArgC dimerization domain-containing protein [Terriglobia bacterium]|nr:Asd/ArgC dimerization domain-containing protein [Terriglobia bacterium]